MVSWDGAHASYPLPCCLWTATSSWFCLVPWQTGAACWLLRIVMAGHVTSMWGQLKLQPQRSFRHTWAVCQLLLVWWLLCSPPCRQPPWPLLRVSLPRGGPPSSCNQPHWQLPKLVSQCVHRWPQVDTCQLPPHVVVQHDHLSKVKGPAAPPQQICASVCRLPPQPAPAPTLMWLLKSPTLQCQ